MSTTKPVARLVMVGASNLRLSAASLVATARTAFDGPVEVFLAHGFGRSYGCRSSIPWRSIPGITECGLWNAVEGQPSLPTFAFVTDVGNDLLYGRSPAQLLTWVTECFTSLRDYDARIVVTELPIGSIQALKALRFKNFRRIFFPHSDLTLSRVQQLAIETNTLLLERSKEYDCHTISLPSEWYGFDPIHFRRRYRNQLSRAVVHAWTGWVPAQKALQLPWKTRIRFEQATPEKWWLFGCERGRSQPAMTLEDGSSVFIY